RGDAEQSRPHVRQGAATQKRRTTMTRSGGTVSRYEQLSAGRILLMTEALAGVLATYITTPIRS
ncbi:hypothetical protein, partial [Actinomadura luteofluorescens]